jgi:hypothetical protein
MERYELETAAGLNDCGKVVTPEPVMDKTTQLVYMDYVEKFLDQDQIDEARIPGCAATAWSGGFQVAGFSGVDTVPQYVGLDILFV